MGEQLTHKGLVYPAYKTKEDKNVARVVRSTDLTVQEFIEAKKQGKKVIIPKSETRKTILNA